MLTLHVLGAGLGLAIASLLLACVFVCATDGAVMLLDRLDRARHDADAEDAATFGEPTRAEVEARVDADHEWRRLDLAVNHLIPDSAAS